MLQLGKLSHYCITYTDCVHTQVISMYVKNSFLFKISFGVACCYIKYILCVYCCDNLNVYFFVA